MNVTPTGSPSGLSASYRPVPAVNRSREENNTLAGPESSPVDPGNLQHLNESGQSRSSPRIYWGKRPAYRSEYVSREQSTELLKRLERLNDQHNVIIEIVGQPGVGKTSLLKSLIYPSLDSRLRDYNLIAWIDCTSLSSAYTDIQAISRMLLQGHDIQTPQDALDEVARYVQRHPRSLLILDGVVLSDVGTILDKLKPWLNPSSEFGRLIYTTTQTLTDKFCESLGRPAESLQLNLFTQPQMKQLVQMCLPKDKESLNEGDFTLVFQLTGGYPEVIQELCQCYQKAKVGSTNFSEFLEQRERHRNLRETLLSKIAQASLDSFEKTATENPSTAQALDILKHAAWLGDHYIPFAFFKDKNRPNDEEAINELYEKLSAILDSDDRAQRKARGLKLNPAFLSVLQKRYESEQHFLLKKNIQRLSEVFSYLTINEGVGGLQKKPEDLSPYADLVYTLLFETCATASFSGDSSLLIQVMELCSSLARLYYLYYGELQSAYDCLQRAKHFFEQGLSNELIERFARMPQNFITRPISEDKARLLQLYAQEYLYQSATMAFQLASRGHVEEKVFSDFEKSYTIQINLDKQTDLDKRVRLESMAFTRRNLTRALRRQIGLEEAIKKHKEFEDWVKQHQGEFDEHVLTELLIDEGIIEKERVDTQKEGSQNYDKAIELLLNTFNKFRQSSASNKNQVLGMLSIYLGEAYLAKGDFTEGITYTCRILDYASMNKGRRARAYFNLARAFFNKGEKYEALAKLFIDLALKHQIKVYKPETESLAREIEPKLLGCYKQLEPHSIGVKLDQIKTQVDLATYCEEQLVKGCKSLETIPLMTFRHSETLLTNGYGYTTIRRNNYRLGKPT